MIGTSIMKVLTTLTKNFYRIRRRRTRIIFNVHLILISHVYISIFMSVSNDSKSHFGELTLNFML